MTTVTVFMVVDHDHHHGHFDEPKTTPSSPSEGRCGGTGLGSILEYSSSYTIISRYNKSRP
eukprot:3624615-Pyramimonas_sp.AAC.1